MSYGRVRRPARRAEYGTTERDVEKRRTRIYIICAVILIICCLLDIFFVKEILGL